MVTVVIPSGLFVVELAAVADRNFVDWLELFGPRFFLPDGPPAMSTRPLLVLIMHYWHEPCVVCVCVKPKQKVTFCYQCKEPG